MTFHALDIETSSTNPEHPEYALQPWRPEFKVDLVMCGMQQSPGIVHQIKVIRNPPMDLRMLNQLKSHVWAWNAMFDIAGLLSQGVQCDKVQWLDAMSAAKWVLRSQKTDKPDGSRFSWTLGNVVKHCLKEWEHYEEFIDIKKEIPKKAAACFSDPGGRWACGEVGILETHDFEKYDYCLNFGADKASGMVARRYYFFEGEISILADDSEYWRKRCELDVEATLLLGQKFWRLMTMQQRKSFIIEQQALYPMTEAWLAGCYYDFQKAENLQVDLESKSDVLRDKLELPADVLASPKKLSDVVYDDWKVPFDEAFRTKTGRSIAKPALTFAIERYGEQFPKLELLKEYREHLGRIKKFVNGPLKCKDYLGSKVLHHNFRINSTYTGRCTVSSKVRYEK